MKKVFILLFILISIVLLTIPAWAKIQVVWKVRKEISR
jgi:hypothetical protein